MDLEKYLNRYVSKNNDSNIILEDDSNIITNRKRSEDISTNIESMLYEIDEYIYYGDENLDMRNYNLHDYKVINLILYNVNTTGIKPFLTYLLELRGDENTYSFVRYKGVYSDVNQTLPYIKNYLTNQKISKNACYKGLLINNNEVCMFFYIDQNGNEYQEKPGIFEWGIVHEIMNLKLIKGIEVNKKVIECFKMNNTFLYLGDMYGNIIESPVIGYNNSRGMFGISRNADESILCGAYVFYHNYDSTKENVRYVLFLGKHVLHNNILEEINWEILDSAYVKNGNNMYILVKNSNQYLSFSNDIVCYKE